MLYKWFLGWLIGTICPFAYSQVSPRVMYRLHFEVRKDGSWNVPKVEFLSGFNPQGQYDHPYFRPNGQLLASVRLDGTDQNDIYSFDFTAKSVYNITRSPVSEYLPRSLFSSTESIICLVTPGDNARHQYLQEIDLLGGGQVRTVLSGDLKIVSYRHFRDLEWICLVSGSPPTLRILSENGKSNRIFASSIGRTFEVSNSHEILFVHKLTDDQWILKAYNPFTEQSRRIAQMPKGTEDFAMDSSQNIYCASGSRILKWVQDHWLTMADLAALKIDHISSLALFQDKLVMVSTKNP